MPLPPRPAQGATGWDTYLDAVIDSYQTRIAALESAASGASAVLDVTWTTNVASQSIDVFSTSLPQSVQGINTTPDVADGVTVSGGVAHVAEAGLYIVMAEVTATSFDSMGGDLSNASAARYISFWRGDGTDLSHQEELTHPYVGFAAGGIAYPSLFTPSYHAVYTPLVAWLDSAYSIGYRCGWMSEDEAAGHVMTETKRLRLWKL